MSNHLSHWLALATQIAQKAGDKLKELFFSPHEIREKAFPGDLVTEADIASEAIIIEALSLHFPSHHILSEESGFLPKNSQFTWAIDPLDGTVNYAHRYPMAAVSMGLLYEKEPILGVIYNPFHGELFLGAKGLGASLNGQPIKVSAASKISESLLATGFAYNRRETSDNNYQEFCRLTSLSQGVRRAGSAALDLAYTACGRLDGFWEQGLKPWDMAAGALILQEAGGRVSHYDQSPWCIESGRILATNGLIHEELSCLLHC